MEKKTRHREPCATIWCLQRGDRETARKRCPHTCVLQSLVMRMILCDSVEPSATCYTADPQLAANSRWGSGSLAHCGEVDAKFSFPDLEKFKKKKKNQQAWETRTTFWLIRQLLFHCVVLEFWGFLSPPAFTCFCSHYHISWQPYRSQSRNELAFTACFLHSLINCKIYY